MHLRNRRLDASNVDGNISEDEEVEDTVALLEDDVVEEQQPEIAIMKPKSGIAGDERNVAVLLFLYILQGIPLGLAAAVPLILTNRHVSYKEQAEFSFAYWPFSLKLLWAPIVDSIYIRRFGRRKTWLVPVQYLIGITMLVLAANVHKYLGEDGSGNPPNVFVLTCMFFFLNFLAATQDIAVDGWALTMLQRHNVGYASTCNSVGQTAGYFLGYVFYMALESYNILTLSDFLNFWGVVFMVATTLVAIFKHEDIQKEKCHDDEEEGNADGGEEILGLVDTYKQLGKIIALPLMPATIIFLMTAKIGFSAADSVTGLKLVEQGVPKAKLAMLAIPMIPLQITLPWIISRYTSGPKPMNIYIKAMTPRLLMGLVFCALVYYTPYFKDADGQFHVSFYIIVLVIYAIHQVFVYCMFVAVMAFFAKVSDPAVGGTYMTFLNTLSNLGGNWPATLSLWWLDILTYKNCDLSSRTGEFNVTVSPDNNCQGAAQTEECEKGGGKCLTEVDGYYTESFICCAIGLLWLGLWGWKTLNKLQCADESEWRVVKKSSAVKTHKKKERQF